MGGTVVKCGGSGSRARNVFFDSRIVDNASESSMGNVCHVNLGSTRRDQELQDPLQFNCLPIPTTGGKNFFLAGGEKHFKEKEGKNTLKKRSGETDVHSMTCCRYTFRMEGPYQQKSVEKERNLGVDSISLLASPATLIYISHPSFSPHS